MPAERPEGASRTVFLWFESEVAHVFREPTATSDSEERRVSVQTHAPRI